MTFKEAFIKSCKIAAFVIPAIIVFIAGIIAKEGVEASGFDKFIGWTTMVVAVGSLVYFFIRYRKQNKTTAAGIQWTETMNGTAEIKANTATATKESKTETVKENTQKANTKKAKTTKK